MECVLRVETMSIHWMELYSVECQCCRISLLGYWAQSWKGHHSNTRYSNGSIIPASWYSFCRPRKDNRLSQPPGVLIQWSTGLELRTLWSQAATLTTKPTPGSESTLKTHKPLIHQPAPWGCKITNVLLKAPKRRIVIPTWVVVDNPPPKYIWSPSPVFGCNRSRREPNGLFVCLFFSYIYD